MMHMHDLARLLDYPIILNKIIEDYRSDFLSFILFCIPSFRMSDEINAPHEVINQS